MENGMLLPWHKDTLQNVRSSQNRIPKSVAQCKPKNRLTVDHIIITITMEHPPAETIWTSIDDPKASVGLLIIYKFENSWPNESCYTGLWHGCHLSSSV